MATQLPSPCHQLSITVTRESCKGCMSTLSKITHSPSRQLSLSPCSLFMWFSETETPGKLNLYLPRCLLFPTNAVLLSSPRTSEASAFPHSECFQSFPSQISSSFLPAVQFWPSQCSRTPASSESRPHHFQATSIAASFRSSLGRPCLPDLHLALLFFSCTLPEQFDPYSCCNCSL